MERNGEEFTPTDFSKYWNYFVVDLKSHTSILYLDGRAENYTFTPDTSASTFTLTSADTENERPFSFQIEDNQLLLKSLSSSDSLFIKLTKVNTSERFNLMK